MRSWGSGLQRKNFGGCGCLPDVSLHGLSKDESSLVSLLS